MPSAFRLFAMVMGETPSLFGMDDEGNPTGRSAFLLQPRSVLLVGNLREFRTDHGVNESKFMSFELLRRSPWCTSC